MYVETLYHTHEGYIPLLSEEVGNRSLSLIQGVP